MTTAIAAVQGLRAGTWTIDPSHSEVSFTVRHLMVSKVRGTFRTFTGAITVDDDLQASSVTAEVVMDSIDTREATRDNHLRTKDFFEIEKYPTMNYRSTGIRADGDDYIVEGELTLHGVTKPVALSLEVGGVGSDPWGGIRAGFSAKTAINRNDFGVDIKMPLDGGGVVVGDKISIHLEIEAVLDQN
ncbi:MAG: polyisoprenoid-binding protein [Geodermatophilaceae bacterium]|nr:polyisoprenoid-binding protein [Geodermatophilaceae bacterium]